MVIAVATRNSKDRYVRKENMKQFGNASFSKGLRELVGIFTELVSKLTLLELGTV